MINSRRWNDLTDKADKNSKKKDILKLLEITGAKKLAVDAFSYSVEMYKVSMPEVYEILMKEINIEEMVEELFVYAYDKYFSETEIEGMIEFYESPLGNKMVGSAPQIYQEVRVMAEDHVKKKLEKYNDDRLANYTYFG